MQTAFDTIIDTYDYEQCKEIVNHGCESGVCSQHIYYGDTVKFYETYEGDILDELTLNYGTEFLIDLFRQADACLDIYKNNVCWAFIELTAMEQVAVHNYEYAASYA